MPQKEYKGIPENTSKNTHEVVAQLLLEEKNVKTVLDIPCGAGAFTKRLMDRNMEVYPADVKDMLQVKSSKFSITDMNRKLPFEDHKFCSIVCIDGIEHIEKPFDFIRECHRVTKKEGNLIISTPNISELRSRWRWLLTGHHNKCKSPLNEEKRNRCHHINMFSFPEIRYLLHTNGFRITNYTTNRIKAISWIYSILLPFSYLMSKWTYSKEEKDIEQRRRNKEIFRQMFSIPVLFGETMIIKAVKL